MTAFFVPEGAPSAWNAEAAYAAICARVEEGTGRAPRSRRIFQLSSRRAGKDCITEVGLPDPVHGEVIVLAILDLGRGQPYVIHCGVPGEEASGVQELVGSHTYGVTEFTP